MEAVPTKVEGEAEEGLQWDQDLNVLVVDSTTGEEVLRAEEVVEEAAMVLITAVTAKIRTMIPQHRTRMVNGEVHKTHTTALRTLDTGTKTKTKTTRIMHHTTTVMIRTLVVMKVRCRPTNLH